MHLVGLRVTAVVLAVVCGTAAADSKSDEAAQRAYEDGRRHYDLREWDQAIAKFKEAYRLRSDAPSLFNIAQAYRLKGDCREAVSFYKTYLRNFPNDKGADKAQKFVDELGDCKDQPPGPTGPTTTGPTTTGPTTTTVTDPGTTTDPTTTTTTDPATTTVTATDPTTSPAAVDAGPARPGRTLRVAGLATGAVGVAALATGVYFGLSARSKQDDLESGMVWNPQLYDDGQSADRNAKIFLGVGGALTVGGVVLYMLGARAGREAPVAVVPRGDGAQVVWSCDF